MFRFHAVCRCCLVLAIALVWFAPRPAEGQLSDAQIEAVKDKGVAFLKKNLPKTGEDSSPMVAYALIKTGTPKNDPFIVSMVRFVKSRVNSSGEYSPGTHHYYMAGTTALFLDALGGDGYQQELKAIADYIIAGQHSNGSWDYPSSDGSGDTSISQYSLLGLWAASRAGIEIPKSTWDRAGRWFLNTQLANGSFIYHPGTNHGGNTPRPSLAVAGGSSLMLCMRELFPAEVDREFAKQIADEEAEAARQAAIPPPNFGGLVELVDVTQDESMLLQQQKEAGEKVSIRTTPEELRRGFNKSVSWLDNNIDPGKFRWPYYYLYGMERMAAFAKLEKVGRHDWYQMGAGYLAQTQSTQGSWTTEHGNSEVIGTSFAVLFLERATARTLGPIRKSPTLGTGLLAGGRGLPKDLTSVQQKDGRIQAVKVEAPIADLLSQLEATGGVEVLPVQEAVIEMVRSDQREELIGQTDRLKKLIESPEAQVRMIALWALSRSDDVTLAPIFIERLRSDKEFDVALEANRGLCVLSRRLEGVGLPEDPLEEQRGTASQEQLKEIAEQWRADAAERWQKWYLSLRPYSERDDLIDLIKSSK